MPRFPHSATHADGLSDRVLGHLLQRAAARGEPVCPLHLGDTYLDPLPAARAEAQLSSERARLHNYAPVQGEPELLDAIIALEPGDEVLLPAPLWALMRGAVKLRGAIPVEVPFFTELDRPDFDPIAALEQACTPRTVAIYLNSPHNPTGRVLPDPLIAALSEFARRRDLWVLTDEVYEDLWFDAPTPSI